MNYICVEGCIGAGKTTVATLLSQVLSKELLLENFQVHPFLDDFYMDAAKYAYETELGFLLIHYHQIKKAFEGNKDYLISDFYICKDMLFAEANILHEKEFYIFKELYDYLASQLSEPDIIIYLSASNELLLKRIFKRGRDCEKAIDLAYIDKINSKYKEHFSVLKKNTRIIKVNMDECDFVEDEQQIDELVNKIIQINSTE